MPYEDKIKIKELGRPTPDLNLEVTGSSRNKIYKRQFNANLYTKVSWICGCPEKNALFCFPCLLFGGDKSWTFNGVKDLAHLSQSVKRHEIGRNHLANEVNLALFGNVNVRNQLDSAYWINIHRHNEQVSKNRYVLSRIIDCIKFCGAFELALRGHDETEESNNLGVFRGLVNFSADLDNALRNHLDQATIFKGTFRDIQNDLLQCMLEVCREKITMEISDSKYLAFIAEETTDVASKFQMVIVLRYVNCGSPVERFWGFINPEQHDSMSLTACICSVIDPLLQNNPNKLVAQAYDGAVVMSDRDGGVQSKIQKMYPMAYFVHCYAHHLNLILSQAVSHNTQVRVFFSNVDDIVHFFSNSPQQVKVLSDIVGEDILWDFRNRAINVIYEHKPLLIECMQQIQVQFSNAKVINQASSIERMLLDDIFNFWLNIFHNIMPHVDDLHNQLQTDTLNMSNAIATFDMCIQNIREDIERIIYKSQDLDSAPPAKRKFISNDSLHASALEVCDIITQAARSRFEYTNHLLASTLFSCEHFSEYCHNFPEDIFQTTITAYPVFENERLKTELSIIYSKPDFREMNGAVAFLNMLKANNLEGTFKETVKLLEIIVTIPMTTAESERCFSTLNRIKTFLRNSMSEDRLSALSMLSIENSLVKSDINFNEKVIERFAMMKERRLDLTYKK